MNNQAYWLLYVLIFFSCSTPESKDSETSLVSENLRPEARSEGLFRLNESERPGNLFPPSICDVISSRTSQLVYEGLFRLDPENLEPVPSLVETWSFNEETFLFTVDLKEGVKFHDDNCFPGAVGRELTAADVEFCFQHLLTPSKWNVAQPMFMPLFVGAEEFAQNQIDGSYQGDFEGIRLLSKYQLQFKIRVNEDRFISMLSRPEAAIYPKEALDAYGFNMKSKMVGTGPFVLVDGSEAGMSFKRNSNYYEIDSDGQSLPYLKGIKIFFISDKKEEMELFKNGELDMVYSLPHNLVNEVLEDRYSKGRSGYSHFQLQRMPELSTEILGMDLESPIFSNRNFRKAIAYAVDRNKLVDRVLKGQAFGAGNAGFVPPGLPKHQYSKIRGYSYSVDSARVFMQLSGLGADELSGLTLHLASRGNFNVSIAQSIKNDLKNALSIDLNIQIHTLQDLLAGIQSGEYSFYRIGWSADYPSIEEFLSVFESKVSSSKTNKKEFPNVAAYNNKNYNNWLKTARESSIDSIKWGAYKRAEQILMEDCASVVLWYDEGYRLLQPGIMGLKMNALQYRDFRSVKFIKPQTLKAK